MSRAACAFCGLVRAEVARWSMCRQCRDSYQRNAHRDGSVMEAMAWAARRAWWFSRRAALAPLPARGKPKPLDALLNEYAPTSARGKRRGASASRQPQRPR